MTINDLIEEQTELAKSYAEDGEFFSAARVLRGLAAKVAQHIEYKNYIISPNLFNAYLVAWCYAHKDYNGPEDNRFGYEASIEACQTTIDDIEDN